MNEENELLDDKVEEGLNVTKAKVGKYRTLIVVVGIFLMLFGLYGIVYIVMLTIEIMKMNRMMDVPKTEFDWFWNFWQIGLNFIFAICSVLGGVGLIFRKRFGWALGLSTSVFYMLLPVLLGMLPFLNSSIRLNSPSLILVALIVVFTFVSIFLLWGSVRRQFSPKLFAYVISGILLALQIFNFLWLPLTQI